MDTTVARCSWARPGAASSPIASGGMDTCLPAPLARGRGQRRNAAAGALASDRHTPLAFLYAMGPAPPLESTKGPPASCKGPFFHAGIGQRAPGRGQHGMCLI